MGSSSKKYRDRSRDRDRDRDEYSDEDDDYSSSRRDRDRKDRSSRRKDKDDYDDYDDRYSTSSKKEKKKKDRKKYDDEDRSSSYDSPRASQVQPPLNTGYSNQGYQQQQQPQGYPSSASQGSWNAPPPPSQQQPQPQYGSAPQSWQNDPRYAPPPRDPYERSNSSYPAPPESSYGQQSSYGGWDNSSQALPPPPRDPRFDQVPSRQNYNQSIPPSQSYPGAPPMQQQDYDRMRPQYDRAPASAPAAGSYQREFSQPPAQSPSFNSAPPFAGPPPPIPPPPIPQPSPLSQPSITAADQWQAYYARQAQAQAQTSSWPPVAPPSTPLQLPPPQQTVSSTPSPGLDNGAQGHWRAGENGQWTWVVVAPEPPPPVQQLPPTPPIYSTPPPPPPPPPSMPPPSYPPQIGSLPSSYPIFSPPPVPSASAPPSTMNPYVQPILSAQQQQQSQMYQAQIPQRPLLPSQTSSYMSGQPQQPIYQVVQPLELVQPVQVPPPRPRPSAPSVPAESEYSDESRGRRRYDDEDEDSDYRSRRGRSNSRRRRRRSRSRSKSTNRSQSRNRGDRNYIEYEEKHYIKSGDPPPPPAPSRNSGRRYSIVEPEEVVRYVDDDRKTRRNDSTPTPAPHLVRRIEVYENDDRPSSSRGGGAGDTRKVYEMRSLGKGQSARRESMSSEAERQRQLAAQIAQEEAAILQQRFGSKSKDSRRVETKSDESWEQVEVPPAQTRRARRNSVADSFRQNHYVEESLDQRARAPVPPSMPPKPSIDNAKASRIAAWSMAVPLTSDMDTLSLDEANSAAISRPRSAMKGGRAQAAPAYSNPLPAVDDLDSVVEPFDPFAPVTTAQSASALYPSWQQSARR
ncbi:hypothetical protein JCM3765_002401 [Sporobolomyces pararoseus]